MAEAGDRAKWDEDALLGRARQASGQEEISAVLLRLLGMLMGGKRGTERERTLGAKYCVNTAFELLHIPLLFLDQ